MKASTTVRNLLLLGSIGILAAGCGGSGGSNNTGSSNNGTGGSNSNSGTPSIALSSSTSSPTTNTGPDVTITATVTNGSAAQVVWTLSGKGSLSPATGATTTYYPDPADTTLNLTATITASLSGVTASYPVTVNFFNITSRFNMARGIVADSSGNLYVADSHNDTIRKLTPSGSTYTVSTIAGMAGAAGYADGDGLTTARFHSPEGIAMDSGGNLYVTELWDYTVRKLTRSGSTYTVSTIAGKAGVAGSVDGDGPTARFQEPSDITMDNIGNLYVADFSDHTIRMITPFNVVRTLAGKAGVYGSADGTALPRVP